VSERRTAVPAEAAQLAVLAHFLQQYWSAANLPASGLAPFELALEEVFVNVATHGSQRGAVPRVNVTLRLHGEELTLTVEDDGVAFDPLSLPDPDVAAPVANRPVGGLGIFLVRQLMDSVRYERIAAGNRLTMTRRVRP
jgi:serine/threonine-protein kinase RsbW